MEIALNLNNFFCPNKLCTHHGKRGLGNIVFNHTYGREHRKILRCKTCNSRFSERRATFFFGMHTKEPKIREVILFLLDGMSFREAAHASNLDKDTVQRIWKKFVAYCEDSMETLLKEFNIQLEDLIVLLHARIQRRMK